MDKKGVPMEEQIFCVGQNPQYMWKTANKGALPAFTATDKILWLRKHQRPLTSLEKFAAHGYPVRADLAQSLGVEAPCPDPGPEGGCL